MNEPLLCGLNVIFSLKPKRDVRTFRTLTSQNTNVLVSRNTNVFLYKIESMLVLSYSAVSDSLGPFGL